MTLRRPENVTEAEQHLLTQLHQAHATFAQAMTLAQDFARLLRARQPERLDAWVQQAATSSLGVFRRVAKSFQRDSAAVKAGVTLMWFNNNGRFDKSVTLTLGGVQHVRKEASIYR